MCDIGDGVREGGGASATVSLLHCEVHRCVVLGCVVMVTPRDDDDKHRPPGARLTNSLVISRSLTAEGEAA